MLFYIQTYITYIPFWLSYCCCPMESISPAVFCEENEKEENIAFVMLYGAR